MQRVIWFSAVLTALLLLFGCGGGGGTAAPPTKAVIKLTTTGSAAAIGDITVTLHLPPGVSVKVKPDGTGQTDDGVVVKSGAAAAGNTVALGKYTAATSAMDLQVVNADGFAPGEFVTVTCDLASGGVPAGGFSTSDFSAFDLQGNPIATLAISQTVEYR